MWLQAGIAGRGSTSSSSAPNEDETQRFGGTWLYRPPVMVLALFLIEHAYSHFLHEGLIWPMALDVPVEDISSLRRNLVLADVMAQLDYMEKRGSGLKKICNATKELETYKEGRDPVFKSS